MRKILFLIMTATCIVSCAQESLAMGGGILCNNDNGCRDDEACVPVAGGIDKRCVKRAETPGLQAMVAGTLCNDENGCRAGELCVPQENTNDKRCVKI